MSTRSPFVLALPALLLGVGAGFLIAWLVAPPAHEVAARTTAQPGALPAANTASTARADLALGSGESQARSTAAPAVAPAAERLDDATVARAVQGIPRPAVAESAGPGWISGSVSDEDGAPLPGAFVVAQERRNQIEARDPSRVGAGPPDNDSLEAHLRSEADAWARDRGRRRSATAGSGGSYSIDGLLPGQGYDLEAYLEGFEIEAQGSARDVLPGRTVAFRARRVYELPVDLAFADGGVPDAGVVRVLRDNRTEDYEWTSERAALRLTSGRVMLVGYAGLHPEYGTRGDLDADFKSSELSVVVEESSGGVRLVLSPRLGLRGRVIEEAPLAGGNSEVVLLALPRGEELDEKALADSDRSIRPTAGLFQFLDLVPGRYAVGVATGEEVLLVHAIVEVTDGLAEVELRIPAPRPEDHLIVRPCDPAGRTLERVSFMLEQQGEGSGRSGSLQSQRGPDGAYWLRPGSGYEDFFGVWPAGVKIELTARHPELGSRSLELVQGQREVEFHFDVPVSIVVEVTGYSGSPVVGKLAASVQRVDESGATDGSRMNFRGMNRGGRGSGTLTSDGRARFDGLEPGTWKAILSVNSDNYGTRTIASEEVTLSGGERSVVFTAPILHQLVVYAPGLAEETWIWLEEKSDRGQEEPGFGYGWWGGGGSGSGSLDEQHRARIEDLVAGAYVLHANGTEATLEVTIPCGEVYFEAREPDCMRVAIGDMEGWLYTNGLRGGDLITGVNGKPLESANQLWEHIGPGMGEGLTVIVLRGGETLSFSVGKVPSGNDWWGHLGGMLTPAMRP